MQTHKDLEIILVDDGSKDRSGEICDLYAKQDERIRVIHKVNGGLSSARNAGLDNAHGKYILFVDGDDYIAENAVEIMLHVAALSNADIVQFNYEETASEYKSIFAPEAYDFTISSDTKSIFDMLYRIGGAAASACTKLYDRALFDSLRFKEGIIHEDEYMATFMLQKASSVAYINNKLYYYVMRDSSIINSSFNRSKLDFFYVSEVRTAELLKLKFYNLVDKERSRYFITAVNLRCNAKKAKDKESLRFIDEKTKSILNENLILSGKFKLLLIASRINIGFLDIYYLYRLLRGQI